MFVRKKPNPSGVISVQIIKKDSRRINRVIKTIGSSSNPRKVEALYKVGQEFIRSQDKQLSLFPLIEHHEKAQLELNASKDVLENVDSVLLNGIKLLIEPVYDEIGFGQINDPILRQLVIARLSQPCSKAGTVSYLKSHFDEDVDLSKVYRYLDKLYNTQQEVVQRISVEHTLKILGGNIGLIFYDVTTLYFECHDGDNLRNVGYSKDGKLTPQIVLGLLVSENGYPLSYSVFNGAQYEGYTMFPMVEAFVSKFQLQDFIVVADAGLMSNANIKLLEKQGYKYIIGARIKNESSETKSWILSLNKRDKTFYETVKQNNSRLIVSYSDKRAFNDAKNRAKGVRRLTKAYSSGKLTKENINKRGYNKFLTISDDVIVSINQKLVDEDRRWDGLKGYLTNTDLPAEEVYKQYHRLWVIEKAFRVTKGTLEMRPIFHFTQARIEAHICICFMAYKVYKELERLSVKAGIPLSVDRVIAIAKTIVTIRIKLPLNKTTVSKTLFLTKQHKLIQSLFNKKNYP